MDTLNIDYHKVKKQFLSQESTLDNFLSILINNLKRGKILQNHKKKLVMLLYHTKNVSYKLKLFANSQRSIPH